MEPEQTPVAPQESEAFAAVARRLAENISKAVQIRPRSTSNSSSSTTTAATAPLTSRAGTRTGFSPPVPSAAPSATPVSGPPGGSGSAGSTPTWCCRRTLLAALDIAAATGVDAVSVPEFSVGSGFWTACRALERGCYVDDARAAQPAAAAPGPVRRLGGFDPAMAGPEDTDLRFRLVGRASASATRPGADRARRGPADAARDLGEACLLRSQPAGRGVRARPRGPAGHGGAAGLLRHRRTLVRHPLRTVGVLLLRVLDAAAYLSATARGGAG